MQPTVLGPYRIDRQLGSGGMGKVYAATTLEPVAGLPAGECVALKVLHPHLLGSSAFSSRFQREAAVGKAIDHANVVRTLDCAEVTLEGQDILILVMEYVEGQTLRGLLVELDPVPEELCRHIGREIARGLAAIHAAGAVHRDIKPDNVLVTADQVVKVMDLGIVKLMDEQTRLSRTGGFVGSVKYAAPEQFEHAEVDHRADLHALGLVLYELSCGRHAYHGNDLKSVMKQVCEVEPTRVGVLNPQLSAFFEEVVHTLLAKKREDRIHSASELLEVLTAGEDSAWWQRRAQEIRSVTRRPLRRMRIQRDTAVHGREPELELLDELFTRAKEGDGRVVLLEGEAGIGKSRLVDELVARLHAGGEQLDFLFGGYPPGGAATARGAFTSAFRERLVDSGSLPYLQSTPTLSAAFDALLAGDSAPTGCQPLSREAVHTCFVSVMRGLSLERPTVIMIDDLHFAPDEGRALFTALAMAVPGHRVLLIGTARPEAPEQWVAGLTRLEQVTAMQLPRLGSKDVASLLKDSFQSEQLVYSLGMRIAEKSDGNPFFIFEIIRGLREGRFITQSEDGTWCTTREIDEIQIPSSVLDLVSARLGDLSDEERELLDIAACCGFEFDPALVAEVVGTPLLPVLRQLARIERNHRLVRSAGRHLVFDHHQVQEAIHGELHLALREEYHARLATILEARSGAAAASPGDLDGELCLALCEHSLEGARGARAVRYLAPAMLHLTDRHLHGHALALGERALAAPGLLSGAERARMLLRCAHSLRTMGRATRLLEVVEEAASLAEFGGDDSLRCEATRWLGIALYHNDRTDEVEPAYRRALDIAVAAGDRRLEAIAGSYLGGLMLEQGRPEEAMEVHRRRLELGIAIGDRDIEAGAMGGIGVAYMRTGRLDEALQHMQQQLEINREIGNRHGESVAVGNMGGVYVAMECPAEALECYERSLELDRETGNRTSEAISLVNVGPQHQWLGNLERARSALETSLAICRETGSAYPEGYALTGLGRLALDEDDPDLARRFFEEAVAHRRRIGHMDGVMDALIELATLDLLQGNFEDARQRLEEAVELADVHGRPSDRVLARALFAGLPGEDAEAILQAAAGDGELAVQPGVLFLAWKVSGDREHLLHAKQLLDREIATAPEEYRAAMRTRLRWPREIDAAWQRETGEPPSIDPDDTWTEG